MVEKGGMLDLSSVGIGRQTYSNERQASRARSGRHQSRLTILVREVEKKATNHDLFPDVLVLGQ